MSFFLLPIKGIPLKSLLKEKVGISWSREMVIGPWPIGGIWLGYDQVGREGTKLLPEKVEN